MNMLISNFYDIYTNIIFLLIKIDIIVKPEKYSIFLKNGKTVISVENRKFSRSRMTKQTAPLNLSREI